MPEEKKTIINKDTLIPIGFVLSLMGAAWFISDINTRLQTVETRTYNVPTRAEFQTLQNDVSEIKIDVKTLIRGSE